MTKISHRGACLLSINNKISQGRSKGHRSSSGGWIVEVVMAGMMVFAFLLVVMTSDVAFAATWGSTSITDTADTRYEAEGDSHWYASDKGE